MSSNAVGFDASASRGARANAARIPLAATLVVGILIFLSVGLFHVWSRVAVVEQGYRLSKQRSVRDELFEERRVLNLELARQRDPARLESAARSFGLTVPQPGQTIFMPERP